LHPVFYPRVGKVHTFVDSRWHYIEFRVQQFNPVHNVVQIRHGKTLVRFVLTDTIGLTDNLLIGAGDNTISCIHGNYIGSKLQRKMVFFLGFLPVEIA
jgi:hypothetical protein